MPLWCLLVVGIPVFVVSFAFLPVYTYFQELVRDYILPISALETIAFCLLCLELFSKSKLKRFRLIRVLLCALIAVHVLFLASWSKTIFKDIVHLAKLDMSFQDPRIDLNLEYYRDNLPEELKAESGDLKLYLLHANGNLDSTSPELTLLARDEQSGLSLLYSGSGLRIKLLESKLGDDLWFCPVIEIELADGEKLTLMILIPPQLANVEDRFRHRKVYLRRASSYFRNNSSQAIVWSLFETTPYSYQHNKFGSGAHMRSSLPFLDKKGASFGMLEYLMLRSPKIFSKGGLVLGKVHAYDNEGKVGFSMKLGVKKPI